MTEIACPSDQRSPPSHIQQLNQVWKQLQVALAQQRSFEAELDQVVQVYDQDVLPREKALLREPCIELIDHLIPFLGNQGLQSWQESALLHWLGKLLGNLSRLDEEVADQFRKEIRFILGESNTDVNVESNVDCIIGFEHARHMQPTAQVKEQQSVVDQYSWFQSLFRKTAQALHPDREQDEDVQAVKVKLMGDLLVARQQGDIVTILGLYRAFVSQTPPLASEELEQLTDVLVQELDQAEREKKDLVMQTPARMFAYDRLWTTREVGLQRNVAKIMSEFQELRESLVYCRSRIQCLSTLSDFLI